MSEVYLNVYDISSGMAKQMSQAFLGRYIEGIWHTAIVVYGTEFFFGGGICEAPPKTTPYGYPVKELKLGTTEIPEDVFREFLNGIASEFTPEKYDLFNHNCNNFSDEVCTFLLGHGIPEEIINLPKEVLNTPLGRMIAPMIQSFTDNLKAQSTGFSSGYGGAQPPMPPPLAPQVKEEAKDNVKEISSSAELEELLQSSLGVVVDFWSPSCGPCMMFKPNFHSLANSNTCPNLRFCSVNTQMNREAAIAYRIRAIPALHFYYKGTICGSFEGANQEALLKEYQNLKKLVEETHPHMSLKFKNFSPEHKEMQLQDSQKQNPAMVKSIKELIEASPNKSSFDSLANWVSAGNFTASSPCTEPIMDQIFMLMKEVPLEKRLALTDLLRVAVLFNKKTTLHMLRVHFDDLQELLISPASSTLESGGKRILFLYAYILKVFANCFVYTEAGQMLLNDQNHYAMLMYLLTTAFEVKNTTVAYSASILGHNMMLAASDRKIFEDNSAELVEGLSKAMSIPEIDEATMYWLSYACGLCLYMCPLEILKEIKRSEVLSKMLGNLQGSKNEKLKDLAGDLKIMLEN